MYYFLGILRFQRVLLQNQDLFSQLCENILVSRLKLIINTYVCYLFTLKFKSVGNQKIRNQKKIFAVMEKPNVQGSFSFLGNLISIRRKLSTNHKANRNTFFPYAHICFLDTYLQISTVPLVYEYDSCQTCFFICWVFIVMLSITLIS